MASGRGGREGVSFQCEDTIRQLLGVAAEEAINTENPYEGVTTVVNDLVCNAEKNNGYVEDLFQHKHYLYSCDGNGAYFIVSSFIMGVTCKLHYFAFILGRGNFFVGMRRRRGEFGQSVI